MNWEGDTKPTDTPAFGNTAASYATHRHGFPPSLLARLQAEGLLKAGHHMLDLGTGTGTLARQAAALGATVTGVDIDANMLAEARNLAGIEGVSVDFQEGPAENTGMADASLDLVTAGQCWHWFKRADATLEAKRILKPGGALLICHFDWMPFPGSLPLATEQLILTYNPDWRAHGGSGIYPHWFQDMAEAGFEDIQSFSYDTPAAYSRIGWVGRIEACAGIAILPAPQREAFKAELTALMARDYPMDPQPVPHRVFAVWGIKPVAGACPPAG